MLIAGDSQPQNGTPSNGTGLIFGKPEPNQNVTNVQSVYNYTYNYYNVTGVGGSSGSSGNGSGSGGGGGGGGGDEVCTPLIIYYSWSSCINGTQSRSWTNGCGSGGTESRNCTPAEIIVPNATIPSGSNATIDVTINATVGIYAYEFVLTYDPSVVSCTNASEGAFLSSDGAGSFSIIRVNNTVGSVVFASTRYGTNSTVTGYGTMLRANFTAVSSGSTSMRTENLSLVDNTSSRILFIRNINGTAVVA
jgi:hypothetical protein